MAYQTYKFPMFTLGEDNPESSTVVQFGRGYSFTSEPQGPDQITFILHYDGGLFVTDHRGRVERDAHRKVNMMQLIDFYETHKLHGRFWFNHPFRGKTLVKFKKPLKWKLVSGGNGVVEPFQIELISQPHVSAD